MTSYYRKNRKKGYTLAEVLTTVMILLILMAIAVPAIFSIRRNLRQKALDNKAELIYTAVQNNLVKLQNNGNSSKYAGKKADAVKANPSDADGDKASVLFFVTSDRKNDPDNAVSSLVTKDIIDDELYNNYWVVEYNPDSASVYAVFYSETSEIEKYDTISYNNLRYKKNRLAAGAKIGYYGGDIIAGGNTSTLAPSLTVTNEEKLTVAISCKRPDANGLTFEVTLKDQDGHSLTLKYKPDISGMKLVHQTDDLYLDSQEGKKNESGTISGIRYDLKLTLDDLTDDTTRFYSLYGAGNKSLTDPNKQLTPGSALTITVTVKSEGSFTDSATASATTNSLFADSTTSETAVIQYGRHLQNLDEKSGVTERITSAVQQSDIHFEKQDDLEEDTEDTTSWYSCYNGKITFTPITNKQLKSYKSSFTDGSTGNTSPTIYHLNVQGKEKAGLFATLTDGMTVDSVRMSGTRITGDGADKLISGKSSAGAIAAETEGNVTIKNCQVFLSNEDIAGKTDEDFWITGAAVQGGLVGKTDGKLEISNSFAATVMGSTAARQAGGLVGLASGESIRITNSYADSYITGEIVGGLIAESSSNTEVSISSCYAAGYLKPAKTGGGFMAAGTANIEKSYTAVQWVKFYSGEETNSSAIRYSTIPSGKADNKVFFLNGGTDYNVDETEKNWVGNKVSYKKLSKRTKMAELLGEPFSNSALATNAYNLKNQGLTGYSYPSLSGLAHYGDWEASFDAGSLVYYEIYAEEDGDLSYGFYGGNIPSTLSKEKTIVGDGYGIAYEEGGSDIPQTEIRVTYQASDNTEKEIKIATKGDSVKKYFVDVKGDKYIIYSLPDECVNGEAADTYYQKLTVYGEAAVGTAADETTDGDNSDDVITGNVFYYNPHFAKTAVNANEAPEVPSEISIRTARQLYHLCLYYPKYADQVKNSSFVQEVNIDYSAYGWTSYANEIEGISIQEPIGVKGTQVTPFTSTYNGGFHEIRGISFSTSGTVVGFIGENAKTVQNVFLVSDYEEGGSNPYLQYTEKIGTNKTVYMGGIAGVNSGRIQNCAVSGYSISGSKKIYVRSNGTFYFGGITGSNRGTITNCEADTPLINSEILYGNAYIAGFAGENASGGRIRNSYAIGHVMVEDAKGGKTVISGFTARNAGYLRGDYCAVALTASGATTSSYGFAPRGGSIVSDCSYLSGGTFRYLGSLYAFDNENGGGTKTKYKDLKNGNAIYSYCKTGTASEESYPFKAVVTDENKNLIHYGNWETAVDLGAIGVMYWELEQGGSNDGYHFSYLGYQGDAVNTTDTLDTMQGSTLCTQHDDGGIITQYGYGYYYASAADSDWDESAAVGQGTPDATEHKNFDLGDINIAASKSLSDRLAGFTVVAYTTKPSVEGTAAADKKYMQMTSDSRKDINGVWKIKYQSLEYVFTINPFFANAMQYGTADESGVSRALNVVDDGVAVKAGTTYSMPGTAGCQYEIRSADQLQYLNWNCVTKDATTVLQSEADYGTIEAKVKGYTYLGYMYSESEKRWDDYIKGYKDISGASHIEKAPYLWQQTHDVDAKMEPQSTEATFTPIGSLYDTNGALAVKDANAYMSYLNGSYNGNTYSIKNIEINSTGTSIGLFGGIIGADVRNIILYSDRNNYIQRASDSPKSWYVMGGLCGFAAVGQENDAGSVVIENCTVSGYTIWDRSTKGAWGDACVGGMFGMSTMDLKNCTAVNNIYLDTVFSDKDGEKKSDGVSVRTGGLVGSMRGNISYCYTGGKISCSAACLNNTRYGYGAKLFLGGITGGICMKSGNFLSLMGKSVKGVTGWTSDTNNDVNTKQCENATTFIYNCYTYIKMPIPTSDAEKKLYKSIEPIGSNGETPFENANNYHVKILIRNCYYYAANMPLESVRPEFRVCDFIGKYKNDRGTVLSDRDWTNIDSNAKAISWKQLAGQELIDGKTLTELLEQIPEEAVDLKLINDRTFSTVTTWENNQEVDGKYTFPGNNPELEGENYPFPTILKQGNTINVHYGEWPLEGIYWEESRASMDIFEDMQLDGANAGSAVKTFNLIDPKPVLSTGLKFSNGDFTVTYSNGEKDTTTAEFVADNSENVVFSDGTDDSESEDSDGFSSGSTQVQIVDSSETEEEPGTVMLTGDDRIAEITDIVYDNNAKCYVATVKALKTGATIITVTAKDGAGKEYSASFNLSVSADFSVYTDEDTIEQDVGESKDVTLYAVPAALRFGVSTASVDEVQAVDIDGWESDGDSEEMENSMGDSDISVTDDSSWNTDTYIDMENDQEAGIEAFAGTAQASTPNFASQMKWTIESSQDGYVTWTNVSNGKFKVTSHAVSNVTLTITGTYTYNGIDYTGVTWVDVNTTQYTGIRWTKEADTLMLSGRGTSGATAVYHLEDKSDCLAKVLDENDFSVEVYQNQNTYAEDGSVVQSDESSYLPKISVAKEAGGYAVTITASCSGKYIISVSAEGKDGKNYSASFILRITFESDQSDVQKQPDSTGEIISSDTPQEDSGFTSDDASDWGNQSDDSVDMIPDQSSEEFADESSGWES